MAANSCDQTDGVQSWLLLHVLLILLLAPCTVPFISVAKKRLINVDDVDAHVQVPDILGSYKLSLELARHGVGPFLDEVGFFIGQT